MKQLLLSAALMIAAVSLALGQSKEKKPGTSSGAEAQVMELDRQAFDAFLRMDTSWHEKNEAEDIIVVNLDGSVTNKQQDIAAMKSGDIKVESGTYDEVQARAVGDVVVLVSKVTLKGTYKGQDASGSFRSTNVYAKRSGKWQLVASQATKVTQ